MRQPELRQLLVVLGPLLVGGISARLIWQTVDRPRARWAFLVAVGGSVIVAYESLMFSLCGLAENTGVQCHPARTQLMLLGIPLLLLGAWAVSRSEGTTGWVLGAMLLAAVLVVPVALHAA